MSNGHQLTISFHARHVDIEGAAPRELAHEVCFALADVFRRHGLGTHVSVSAAMTDDEVLRAAIDIVKSAAADGMSNQEIADRVMGMKISAGIPDEVAPKHTAVKVVSTKIGRGGVAGNGAVASDSSRGHATSWRRN